MKQLFFTLLVASLFASCTDAEQSKVFGLGNKFKIEVLSGGQIVRTYTSTGKVITEKNSDGYYFTDSATGKLVEISGEVIITQID